MEMMCSKGKAILNALGLHEEELSIVIIDDREMMELNREYRGKNAPTNVLSFSMRDGEFAQVTPLLGDVVISADTAAKEAADYGITLDERLTQLLVHGILHLAGYDHERGEEEARLMEAKSLELIRMLETNPDLDYF